MGSRYGLPMTLSCIDVLPEEGRPISKAKIAKKEEMNLLSTANHTYDPLHDRVDHKIC
jgi:hypothetical protein